MVGDKGEEEEQVATTVVTVMGLLLCSIHVYLGWRLVNAGMAGKCAI